MFPQANASGIDTVSLGATLLKRKAELLANPGAPPAVNMAGTDDGGDGPGDLPPEQRSNPQTSSARPTRHRRAATTKHTSKKASAKAR